MMRLLIDSTQVPLARTGVGIYAEYLIQELAAILDADDKVFILVQSDDRVMREIIASRTNLEPIVVNSSLFRDRAMLGLYEQFILPWLAIRHRIHAIHSLHYTFPLICPCRRIVTVHDMTFFLWPQMHTRARRIIMPFFIKMALRHAEGVLFVSESTRKDAELKFGTGKNMRHVAPLGVNDRYFSALPDVEIERALARLEISFPYILFVGTIEPRKNLLRLIRAFEQIAEMHPDLILVIAGGRGWDYEETFQAIDRSKFNARIRRLGYVSEDDKLVLTVGCKVLVYPSLYEGFGMPVLEGMAAGVPVITSNTSSLPEVAGDAAILIDPTSIEQIAAAIDSVLSGRIDVDTLVRAGRQQAEKFPWKRTAELTRIAYMKVAKAKAN